MSSFIITKTNQDHPLFPSEIKQKKTKQKIFKILTTFACQYGRRARAIEREEERRKERRKRFIPFPLPSFLPYPNHNLPFRRNIEPHWRQETLAIRASLTQEPRSTEPSVSMSQAPCEHALVKEKLFCAESERSSMSDLQL